MKLIFLSVIGTAMLLFWGKDLQAQKPSRNSHLEIIPDQRAEYIRLPKMRINRENGLPVALYRQDYPVSSGLPQEMAWQYLRENTDLLKIESYASDLKVSSVLETPGGYHVRFQQYYQEYPVYNGNMVVNLNRRQQVTLVMNSYQYIKVKSLLQEAISAAEAERIANEYLKMQGKINYKNIRVLVYVFRNRPILVYRVTIVPAEYLAGDWEILVDAVDGKILRVEDKALYGENEEFVPAAGRGRVFDPDPLTRAGALYQAGGQFGDNNDNDTDSLVAQIVWRDLPYVEFSGGQYQLQGPCARIEDFESPYKGLFNRPDSIWDFTRNPDAFEAVNVYYHVDKSMRYINDSLGFQLLPYQYSGGVRFDPHGLNGDDNSHYIPSTGRVAWGEGGVDDAEDPDVVLHELGHGIHDWITFGNLSQVDGLSEGCGDYWASSYNRSRGFWTPLDQQYYWVFQWDGHNEFWGGRVTNYSALYPAGLVGQIHTDGQIWASTLMQIWDDIGRRATDANFLEALSMLNSSSDQEDAAQAFIQADLNLHGGANLPAIEYWFTRRGYSVTVPLIGPNSPENLTAYSDYRTPDAIRLAWQDPVTLANGDTLLSGEFHIFIKRDNVLLDSVAGGTEYYTDSGLTDGQLYSYQIYARLDSLKLVSEILEAGWIAGGSPIPSPPLQASISNLGNQVLFRWQNPAENTDGTPLDDFAGIQLYLDSSLVNTFSRNSSDTTRMDSGYYDVPGPGFHQWYLCTVDNESPENLSIPSERLITPLNVPMGDLFMVAGSPDPGRWLNRNAEINDMAQNPPSGPGSLNLNGKPDGGDLVELYPMDLSTYQGLGMVFSYYFQPEGQSNAPEPQDSLLVYFRNSIDEWILVRGYGGSAVQPFQMEIIDLDTQSPGNGTFFHSQFQVRFRNIGSASLYTPNDDWFIDNVFLGIPAPLMTVSSDSIQFDTTLVDSSSFREMEIYNAGLDSLWVEDIFLTNPEFSAELQQISLAAGERQVLRLSFTPAQGGLRQGWLYLVSNDSATDTLRIHVSGQAAGISSLDDQGKLPMTFAVYQNYPNPFNPVTIIRYDVPHPSDVKLIIYNLLGQKVRTLLNQPVRAGRHHIEWDARNDQGAPVASGIYIYHFESAGFSRNMKLILLK